MHARVTRFAMNIDRRDEATRISDTRITPGIQQEPGFKQMYALVDPDTGEGLVLTVWESEDDEAASRSHVGHYFGMLGPLMKAPPDESHVYEIVGSA